MKQTNVMSDDPKDPIDQRNRAKILVEKVKEKLITEFDKLVNFENDQLTNLKFVIKSKEMMLEYKNGDAFELYDRDAKTQRNETLGEYSSANIRDSSDPTPDKIVSKIKEYTS